MIQVVNDNISRNTIFHREKDAHEGIVSLAILNFNALIKVLMVIILCYSKEYF